MCVGTRIGIGIDIGICVCMCAWYGGSGGAQCVMGGGGIIPGIICEDGFGDGCRCGCS